MCKIYEFPKTVTLPEELEKKLQRSAKDYVNILNEIMQYFEDECSTDEEMWKVMETMMNVYLETLNEAIEKLEV